MFGQAINSGAVAPKGISDVDADFLVVAGGASGGGSLGGGGGAGGLRTSYGSTSGGGASNESKICLLYTSPSPRDRQKSRMPSSA